MSSDYSSFCDNITVKNFEDMKTTTGNIAKKLNEVYYGLSGDDESHMYIVGSVGRKTAVDGNSDLDILFDMPNDIFKKYDAYESNGQSSLLQDVKNTLLEKYPSSNIRGDGQVVVISFNKYTIELVPAFKQSDNRFKYPDTHDDGSWKYTDPLSEQEECSLCNSISDNKYYDFCRMVRCWKNNTGFKFGGLLIDTLVYNYFCDNNHFEDETEDDYTDILLGLFEYLKSQNKDQKYWYAVGSNQHVYNSDNGKFVTKAKKAYTTLKNAIENDDTEQALSDLFGSVYTDNSSTYVEKSFEFSSKNTEEFIEQKFSVDIRNSLDIDCIVSQNGFRDKLLSLILKDGGFLRVDKRLTFKIIDTDCKPPYEIYWKVRNVGSEAERRNMIRGEIRKTNSKIHKERTDFKGPHYVECFLVKNGICVARDRISVPIETKYL